MSHKHLTNKTYTVQHVEWQDPFLAKINKQTPLKRKRPPLKSRIKAIIKDR